MSLPGDTRILAPDLHHEVMRRVAENPDQEPSSVITQVTEDLTHGVHPKGTERSAFSNNRVVQSNILDFESILADRLEPHRTIVDAMRNLMKAVKITKEYTNKKGELKFRDIYVMVPDLLGRARCAETILRLCGADPAQKIVVDMGNMTPGNVTMIAGNVYAHIARYDNDEDMIRAHNQFRIDQRAGTVDAEYRVLPPKSDKESVFEVQGGDLMEAGSATPKGALAGSPVGEE